MRRLALLWPVLCAGPVFGDELREVRSDAPVTRVTVYSDRARVTRTAQLKLSGSARVALPLLLPGTDPGSVRVEARGGEVESIDLRQVSEDELPTDAARALLDRLDRLGDQRQRVQREAQALRQQLDLLSRLAPTPPNAEPQRPVPRLKAGAWGQVLAFQREQQQKAQERLARVDAQDRALQRDEDQAIAEAQKAGLLRPRRGLRVTPVVRGDGPVELTLSYLVTPARWQPRYDIQLLPDSGQVELRFLGLVSQESGEDWSDAALTLSTAVPTQATQLPRLNAWRIGQRERFIPTPPASAAPPLPPPPAPPLLPELDPGAALRARVAARLGGASGLHDGRQQKEAEERSKSGANGLIYLMNRGAAAARSPAAPRPAAPPPPPPPPPPPDEAMLREERAMPAAQEAAPMMARGRSFASVAASAPGSSQTGSTIITETVGLVPPPAYQPPRYAGDLPAALAGGYDLTYAALQRETVRSGQGARRIALFSKQFPVSVQRKIVPAMAAEAFLVAEIKNPTGQPLPGGAADLFVGADPAGVANLALVAPGESFTLPLGIDRALRPARNVRLRNSERGVFSKDDITEYTVTTTVANPYRTALSLWLVDQLPLAGDKNVEVQLLRSDPPARQDAATGALEWRLSVPPGGKAQTTFVYTLRRPSGARLSQ